MSSFPVLVFLCRVSSQIVERRPLTVNDTTTPFFLHLTFPHSTATDQLNHVAQAAMHPGRCSETVSVCAALCWWKPWP